MINWNPSGLILDFSPFICVLFFSFCLTGKFTWDRRRKKCNLKIFLVRLCDLQAFPILQIPFLTLPVSRYTLRQARTLYDILINFFKPSKFFTNFRPFSSYLYEAVLQTAWLGELAYNLAKILIKMITLECQAPEKQEATKKFKELIWDHKQTNK